MTLLGKGILVVGETSGIGFGVAQAVRMALSCLDAAR
jgi:NAD(P)-dependent dehydrogenase (short-subunit alcohol dehydrogenase family)